jgi:hypothetical protein
MSTLPKELRKQLETVVLKAREEAERGAAAALESYGVGEAKKPTHLDKAGEELRRKLRARGRQAGDLRRPDESQELEHLVQECAYEHWHRMLFARFLAENGLLIEPESGLDVDLDYCEEQARESKSDKWEVAAGFAQRMLLGIFRPDDPVLQLRLPAESRNRLTALLGSLHREVFLADNSLGWVYQFWQAKKREEVNASGDKIGADELAPVTQLFTEDYMVEFLLHNTLGAWWAGRKLQSSAHGLRVESEGAARIAVSLPGINWDYLRFVQKDGTWQPASGTFDNWPKAARDLRLLDPSMGSGHFLVAELPILVAMRREEENLSVEEAVTAVLRDNLFGLELDPRCAQIAAFNLALSAWKLVGQNVSLPQLNLACSGLGVAASREEWLAILEQTEAASSLRFFFGQLYDLFRKAPLLGSLINPARFLGSGMLDKGGMDALMKALDSALERTDSVRPDFYELEIAAQGLARAAQLLGQRYHLIGTNVPYLARGKQDGQMMEFLETFYPSGKSDLASAFVLRCLEFCEADGTTALVTPQSWLFLTSYKSMRESLLHHVAWNCVARLGARAFETISGEVVNVSLVILTRRFPSEQSQFASIDVAELKTPKEKDEALSRIPNGIFIQASQLRNPDARVSANEHDADAIPLGNYAECYQGAVTGDLERFRVQFWEILDVFSSWQPFRTTVEASNAFGGLSAAIRWEGGSGDLHQYAAETRYQLHDMHESGNRAWKKVGVAINRMGDLLAAPYLGEIFDNNVAVAVPKHPADLPALLAFCTSPEFVAAVRSLDQSIKITNRTLIKVPFEVGRWRKIGSERYPTGLPKPSSKDSTQWLFNGHPKDSDHPLQVAVARLLGYRWPRQTGSSFPDCPALSPDGLEKHADNDGVVCFSQVRDEAPAATRLRALLADAYGAEWSHATERKLVAATGSKADSLEDWLLNDFFVQHCVVFNSRPFIWHIWDGRRDGFNVLVNYHKLAGPNAEGHRTLETLAYAYLGDWIARQKAAMGHGEAGADGRLAVALELQAELKNILVGEPPYDLFIRWKTLARQPVGWSPDLNDGVRLNIRPFMAATLSSGKAGAGVLRAIPKGIKWTKDRGTEPANRSKEDFPWFWSWDEMTTDWLAGTEFTGERWNDCHYSTRLKLNARTKEGTSKP